MPTEVTLRTDVFGLNRPGFLYLNERVLANVKSATGDEGKGTVDELKFGPLYNRISELLFPWCSTLTSRARYFFFTYAVLQIALDRTVPREKQDPNRDWRDCDALSSKLHRGFIRHVRRIEKFLTIALVDHEETQGTFGRRRVNRWFNDGRNPVGAKSYEMILSADSRYANAIYRASCRELGLFIDASANRALLSRQLRGERTFRQDWVVAGARALKETKDIVDYWEKYDPLDSQLPAPLTPLSSAREKFRDSLAWKNFNGFAMPKAEAEFLYRQIQAATNYWQNVPLKKLKEIYSSSLTLSDLQFAFVGHPGHSYLLAGEHIDVVTKYWRHYYQEIVRNPQEPPSIRSIQEALPEIRTSINWLNRTAMSRQSKAGWEGTWLAEYQGLIEKWVGMVGKGKADELDNALKARAEKVVHERGRGKVPPHKRPPQDREDDLTIELDLQGAGFRFGNASRILEDIGRGVTNG